MQGIDNLPKGGGSSTLSGLSDVNFSSLTAGDLLIYDGAEWINHSFTKGHTILNESGTAVTARDNLQFTDGLKVTDDSANNKTKVGVNTEFTEALAMTNIESGDPFSTILGKIKKWFSDLPGLFVYKHGDIMTGALTISRKNSELQANFIGDNTETTSAASMVSIGNAIADGTVGSTYGRLRIMGKGIYRTDIEAPDSTTNRSIKFPNKNGTIALTTDVPTKVSNLTDDTNTNPIQVAQKLLADNSNTISAQYVSDVTGTHYKLVSTNAQADVAVGYASQADTAGFASSAGTAQGVSGTVAIANGGTGATTRLGAAQNLTNESVSSPGYVVGLTQSWGKFGYTSLPQLKTAMSLNNVNNTADANKAVNVSAKLGRNGDTSLPMTFNWSGATGQPPWVWGGSDAANMYVYNPSNFSVASATSSTKDACPRVENKNLNTDGNINGGTSTAKFSECGPSCSNLPDSNWYFIISMGSADSGYGAQLAIGMTTDYCWVRRKDGGSWKSWRRLI